MAFPVVLGRTANGGPNTGTRTANLPADIAEGDFLVLFVSYSSGASVNTPSGWNLYGSRYDSDDGDASLNIYTKTASGSEGTSLTITGTSLASIAFASLRLAGNVSAFEVSAKSSGGSGNPDSPNFDPSWGTEDTLWISVFAGRRAGTYTLTSGPSSYSNAQMAHGTSGTNRSGVGTAERELTASEENPGAWTISHSLALGWVAVTIGINVPPTRSSPREQRMPTAILAR